MYTSGRYAVEANVGVEAFGGSLDNASKTEGRKAALATSICGRTRHVHTIRIRPREIRLETI